MSDALSAADLAAALQPQVYLVKVDAADRILDVRQAPLDFLVANLAASQLLQGPQEKQHAAKEAVGAPPGSGADHSPVVGFGALAARDAATHHHRRDA